MAVKILVKNNKGGVGKSILSLWLAHGLSLENKKVLIITSDSQNNIPTFAGKSEEAKRLKTGLESWIKEGIGGILELREQLFYIPLMVTKIDEKEVYKFSNFIEKLENKFDYIIIDASPVLELDNLFVEIADKIVIPTYLDDVTTESIIKFIKSVGLRKIKAIIPNRTHNSITEKRYYSALKKITDDSSILLTEQIKHSGLITRIIADGKTIFEAKNKYIDPIQKEIQRVIEVLKYE